MILANKNGWLVAVTVLRETRNSFIVKPIDDDAEQRFPKSDARRKLFDDADSACKWIKEGAA